MLVKTEQFDVVNQWKTILELFYVKTLISRRSMTNALLFLCQKHQLTMFFKSRRHSQKGYKKRRRGRESDTTQLETSLLRRRQSETTGCHGFKSS